MPISMPRASTTSLSTEIDDGGGWPQSDGNVHPPAFAYDAISNQSLLAYRDGAGNLTASQDRSDGVSDAFPLVEKARAATDVSVALSPIPRTAAGCWPGPPAARRNTVRFRPPAICAGTSAKVDQAALTTVGLSCIRPQDELDLALDEDSGATVFADSSSHDLLVTCGETGVTCPQRASRARTATRPPLTANRRGWSCPAASTWPVAPSLVGMGQTQHDWQGRLSLIPGSGGDQPKPELRLLVQQYVCLCLQ